LKKSHYFSELIRSYNAEVDDLVTDSAGKSVLQKRLDDKRHEMDAILPMIEFSPEMVAVVFYDAFDFHSSELMRQIIVSEPDDPEFIAWETLKNELTIADWAQPLIASALKTKGGDCFLVSTAALEYLRTKSSPEAAEPEPRDEDEGGREDDEDGSDDLSEAGADWLAEQGFETLER
jgi:hypothetical protein